jgi:lipoprotein signal peptidase
MNATGRTYRGLFWALAAAGLLLDLSSKYAVFAWLEPGEAGKYEIIPGVFSLIHQPELNRGALFGLGNHHGHLANLVFAAISATAVGVIVWWSFKPSVAGDRLLSLALGLILAGALGNLYDRLVFGGVRDWIWFYWEPHFPRGWPVFNLADTWLVCGAGLLLLQAIFARPAAEQAQPNPEVKAA